MLVTMSKLPLYTTSTELASSPGSVADTMQSPSGGDTGPLVGSEEEEGSTESAKQLLAESLPEPLPEPLPKPVSHDAASGDAEDSGEEEEAETAEVAVAREEREEDDHEGIEKEDAQEEEEDLQEEEDEVGEEHEMQAEEEHDMQSEEEDEMQAEEEHEMQEGEVHEILAEDIQEGENEVPAEEEVEEYKYTKEEVMFMKTAFAAYQTEKKEKKKAASARKKGTAEIKVTEIPISTLGSVLRSLGLNPTQAALQSYADWLDADPKDGVVKFEELLIIVGREKKVAIDESHVLEAFRFIDVENNQSIPIETLHQLLVLSGERFSPAEWIIFVQLADPKKTAFVNYENFVARMGPNPSPPEKKKKKGKKGKKKGKGKHK